MNEAFIQQVIAQLIAANEAALGIVVAAIAKQPGIDPSALRDDLKSQIKAAQTSRHVPEQAIQQANVALAAVEAAVRLRNLPKKH